MTLVELLVVIVVIVILLGLLFPPRSRIRDGARRVMCLNNLKQIGTALALYYDDYTNAPPSIAFTNLGPYIGHSYKILHCPSDRDKRVATNGIQLVSHPGLYCSYWYCPSMISRDEPCTPVAWDRGVCERCLWPTNSAHKGGGGNILWSDGHVDWNRRFPTNLTGVVRFE
jgi:prepilin-type processing-associated H-X9-DG protein